jgi:hypothetical protein
MIASHEPGHDAISWGYAVLPKPDNVKNCVVTRIRLEDGKSSA